MKWNRITRMFSGFADSELLNLLAEIVRLPEPIEFRRRNLNTIQGAVDQERIRPNPMAAVDYPVSMNLFQHQVRAANMALLTFGMISPKEVEEKYARRKKPDSISSESEKENQ